MNQNDFFAALGAAKQAPEKYIPEENPDLSDAERERLHNQLIKLGDMMGDGMHHEPDGAWITREYRAVMKALYPGIYKKQRAAKAAATDQSMAATLAEKKCPCGGELKQNRKGAKTCHCLACGKNYRVVSRRRRK